MKFWILAVLIVSPINSATCIRTQVLDNAIEKICEIISKTVLESSSDEDKAIVIQKVEEKWNISSPILNINRTYAKLVIHGLKIMLARNDYRLCEDIPDKEREVILKELNISEDAVNVNETKSELFHNVANRIETLVNTSLRNVTSEAEKIKILEKIKQRLKETFKQKILSENIKDNRFIGAFSNVINELLNKISKNNNSVKANDVHRPDYSSIKANDVQGQTNSFVKANHVHRPDNSSIEANDIQSQHNSFVEANHAQRPYYNFIKVNDVQSQHNSFVTANNLQSQHNSFVKDNNVQSQYNSFVKGNNIQRPDYSSIKANDVQGRHNNFDVQRRYNSFVKANDVQIPHNSYIKANDVQSQKNSFVEANNVQSQHNSFIKANNIQSQYNSLVKTNDLQRPDYSFIKANDLQSQHNSFVTANNLQTQHNIFVKDNNAQSQYNSLVKGNNIQRPDYRLIKANDVQSQQNSFVEANNVQSQHNSLVKANNIQSPDYSSIKANAVQRQQDSFVKDNNVQSQYNSLVKGNNIQRPDYSSIKANDVQRRHNSFDVQRRYNSFVKADDVQSQHNSSEKANDVRRQDYSQFHANLQDNIKFNAVINSNTVKKTKINYYNNSITTEIPLEPYLKKTTPYVILGATKSFKYSPTTTEGQVESFPTTPYYMHGFTKSFNCKGIISRTCSKLRIVNEFKCKGDAAPISIEQFCDGSIDCPDGSDEKDCVRHAAEKIHHANEIFAEIELAKHCYKENISKNPMLLKQGTLLSSILKKQVSFLDKYSDNQIQLSDTPYGDIYEMVAELGIIVRTLSHSLKSALCTNIQTEIERSIGSLDTMLETTNFIDEDSLGDCLCKNQFCLKARLCTTECKRVCLQTYGLERWNCKAVKGGSSISLDKICDWKPDCVDKSDEINCATGFAKTEADRIYEDIIKMIQSKTKTNEYEPIRSELVSLYAAVKQLQIHTTQASKVNFMFLKSERDTIFSMLKAIYKDILREYNDFDKAEEIYDFLMSVNVKMVNALKQTSRKTENDENDEICSCQNRNCTEKTCSKRCVRICSVKELFTVYPCPDVTGMQSVKIDMLCDGKEQCLNGEDEANCVGEICRTHHLLELRRNLMTIKKEKYNDTVLGDAIASWHDKANERINLLRKNDRLDAAVYKSLIHDILINELVTTYANIKDLKNNNSADNIQKKFENVALQMMNLAKACTK